MAHKNVDHNERILILEMGYERHEVEMRELRNETRLLKTAVDTLVKTNLQIRNWIVGGLFVVIAEKFGILSILENYFR